MYVSGLQQPQRLHGLSILLPSVYTKAVNPGVKRTGCGADNVTATDTEVENVWSHTSSLP